MLKLSIPAQPNLYRELVRHPAVARVVALSGGYSRAQACVELARRAMADGGALPIFIKARALAAGAASLDELARIGADDLIGHTDDLRALLADPDTRWIYLIDGLDEADAKVWDKG